MPDQLYGTMLNVMRDLRNFFEISVEAGSFVLEHGKIELKNDYVIHQYVLLTGSKIVDGVYKIMDINDTLYTLSNADRNESWNGRVYGLSIPSDFIDICRQITEFNSNAVNTGITSETVLNVHSWSIATNQKGMPATWRDLYMPKLLQYRKLMTQVKV